MSRAPSTRSTRSVVRRIEGLLAESVPPEGIAPSPTTFAESCLVFESVVCWLVVWLTGIAPATSWTPTTRSASELQPDGLIGRDCTCDLADPNGAPCYSATTRKRGRHRNRTRPSRHPPFEGGRHPVRLLPASTTFVAVEGIGPSVRPRQTNGLVAFLALRVVASPEAPRSQSTESNRHAGGNEPPRCPARTAFELRERAHRMGRPRKRRATTLVSVTGIEPVFPV